MDPDETLKDIRELVGAVRATYWESGAATDLADRVESLDEWLSQGGFLPQAWRGERKVDNLLETYADAAEKIYRDRTAGDYTWRGLLAAFLREVQQ